MKVFLSHKMSGVPEKEVLKIRKQATDKLKNLYGDNIEIIDNFNHHNAPENAGRLWHLGRSIQQLQDADAIYFCEGNDNCNGCMVEKLISKLYKLKVLNEYNLYDTHKSDVNKYKTKPCEIEAIQWTGMNLNEIKSFVDNLD